MILKRISIVFSFVVGISMILLWAVMYAGGQIPEVETEPARIAMHIAAEITTGSMLVISSILLIKKIRNGYKIFLVSMGMLIYTLIQSPGYYLELGDYGFVIMFAIIFVVGLILLIEALRKGERYFIDK